MKFIDPGNILAIHFVTVSRNPVFSIVYLDRQGFESVSTCAEQINPIEISLVYEIAHTEQIYIQIVELYRVIFVDGIPTIPLLRAFFFLHSNKTAVDNGIDRLGTIFATGIFNPCTFSDISIFIVRECVVGKIDSSTGYAGNGGSSPVC